MHERAQVHLVIQDALLVSKGIPAQREAIALELSIPLLPPLAVVQKPAPGTRSRLDSRSGTLRRGQRSIHVEGLLIGTAERHRDAHVELRLGHAPFLLNALHADLPNLVRAARLLSQWLRALNFLVDTVGPS